MYNIASMNMVLDKLRLPTELIDIIKEYTQPKVNKIPSNDARYDLLRTITIKMYDPEDEVAYVYLRINDDKDYFLTSTYKEGHAQQQLQTMLYTDYNFIYQIEGHIIDF